jgi:hypothetical protein
MITELLVSPRTAAKKHNYSCIQYKEHFKTALDIRKITFKKHKPFCIAWQAGDSNAVSTHSGLSKFQLGSVPKKGKKKD